MPGTVRARRADPTSKPRYATRGYRTGRFQRGISQYPTIDDEVHLVSEMDLQAIYGRSGAQNHFVRVGHVAGSESIDALVDINKLITRHLLDFYAGEELRDRFRLIEREISDLAR